MKKLIVLASCVIMVSCASTKIKKLIPSQAYNVQRISRKCYTSDFDYENRKYRFIIWDRGDFYELYNMLPVERIGKEK